MNEMLFWLVLGLIIVSYAWIKSIILDTQRKRCVKVFKEFPDAFIAQMLHCEEFTYYDKFGWIRIHDYRHLKSTTSDIIFEHFTKRHCRAILKLSINEYKVWQHDLNYLKAICRDYNAGLFRYVVLNRIWESYDIEPRHVDEYYIEKLSKDILHKLAQVSTDVYQKLQLKNDEFYNIENIKTDNTIIKEWFVSKDIKYLFHFTDIRNVKSIIRNGGLFSWWYCEKHNIPISNAGGDNLSRSLDRRHGIEDYVHLSFAHFHPMSHQFEMAGNTIVELKIHPAVALFSETLFSTENATSNSCIIGADYATLNLVDYNSTQLGLYKSDPRFGKMQAEVMVRTYIPLKYILNLKEICEKYKISYNGN